MTRPGTAYTVKTRLCLHSPNRINWISRNRIHRRIKLSTFCIRIVSISGEIKKRSVFSRVRPKTIHGSTFTKHELVFFFIIFFFVHSYLYKQSRPLAVRRKKSGYCVLTGRILTNEALMYFHFWNENIYELRYLNQLFSTCVLKFQDRGRNRVTLSHMEIVTILCVGKVVNNNSRFSIYRNQHAMTNCSCFLRETWKKNTYSFSKLNLLFWVNRYTNYRYCKTGHRMGSVTSSSDVPQVRVV